jgi:hypothetical protein
MFFLIGLIVYVCRCGESTAETMEDERKVHCCLPLTFKSGRDRAPRDGLYMAEYLEPQNGRGSRLVRLFFSADKYRGWIIVPDDGVQSNAQKKKDRKNPSYDPEQRNYDPKSTVRDGGSSTSYSKPNGSLGVKEGSVERSSGKIWWKEEGPGTVIESYGYYNFDQSTFYGTWAATIAHREVEEDGMGES